MPMYEYQCDGCGHHLETMTRGDSLRCPNCGAHARRRWGVRIGRASFPGGHFNVAAGRYVSSETELRDAFKQTSEEQTALTGVPVDIQPIDYGDREGCGITDADIDRMAKEKADAP